MTTMMTTRMVVRNGACCSSLRGLLRFYHRRRAPAHLGAPPRHPLGGAAPASRRAFVVRAVATDAATDATTSAAKPFKRHERIAAIKVRAPSRARALGRPPWRPLARPIQIPAVASRPAPRDLTPCAPHPSPASTPRSFPPRVLTAARPAWATPSRSGGWVRTGREQGNNRFAFLEVNDGSSLSGIQAVVTSDALGADLLGSDGGITTGAAVKIEGVVVESPGGKQAVEVKATAVRLVGAADASTFPLQKKRHTLEFLRGIAHLRPRTNTIGAVTRVRNQLAYATHTFFQSHGFQYVNTPIVTASDCEGAGEQFQVTTLLNGADGPSRRGGEGVRGGHRRGQGGRRGTGRRRQGAEGGEEGWRRDEGGG